MGSEGLRRVRSESTSERRAPICSDGTAATWIGLPFIADMEPPEAKKWVEAVTRLRAGGGSIGRCVAGKAKGRMLR